MKKIALLLIFSAALFSCKNSEEKNGDTESTTSENVAALKTYKGDFLNSEGAIVLMGSDFIYAVKNDGMAQELSKKTAAVKKNDFDMVPVTVKGEVSKNTDGDSQWEEEITIKEIVEVSNTPSEADIKLEETAKKN